MFVSNFLCILKFKSQVSAKGTKFLISFGKNHGMINLWLDPLIA